MPQPTRRRGAEAARSTYDAREYAADGSLRRGFDAVTVLTVYVGFLLLIPSDRVVPGLGNLGAPAVLWGLACFLWWIWHVLSRPTGGRAWVSPVSVAALVFFATVLLSYIFGMLRAIPPDELLPADRGLLRMLSFLGVALVAADGIRTFSRLLVLLRRVTVLTAAVAAFGIVEFAVRRPLADMIGIPGLVSSGGFGAVERGGFLRPSSTAIHPLEYATVLSVALPVALMLTLRSRGRTRATMLACAGLIAVALLLAGSRSAVVGLLVGVVPLLVVLGTRERLLALVGGAVAVVIVYVTVPGMLGTLRNMFETAGTDTSVLSRTDSLGVFEVLFPISPWVGRGLGTLLPEYRIFDNQFLALLLEIGVVGTAAFIALYVVAIACVVACRTAPPAIAGMAAALAAGCLVAISLSGFFDSFSFPKAFGVLALVAGLCGAASNIAQDVARRAPRGEESADAV